MGTNYYYHEKDPCPHCGREYRSDHIGKSSFGWTFTFHAFDGIRSYEDLLALLESGGRIIDEYGDETSLENFKELVESKREAKMNHAVESKKHSWGERCFLDEQGNSFSYGDFS